MTQPTTTQIFLSYSRNDLAAANALRAALEQAGFEVFKDDASIRGGERWLTRLQQAVAGCAAFVVLVGRDGVRRWVGAEVEVALVRHLSPQQDGDRLPIFPLLLDDTAPETLPPFLALFQATGWTAAGPLPEQLIDDLRAGTSRFHPSAPFEGCPFLGLKAFGRNDARLFFGRRA
ncbi:MAG: toll/interleukin-1 receptor domain-containing protein, partial [Xanthomonadales bacterium]|nr:toll/interleukin-1 receptor domain-containing protein [Xanthomonadales bacterium]